MVKHREFDRHNIARTSVDTVAPQFDLTTQVERPFGIGTRCVEDCSDVVSQDDRRKEGDVDVSGELEDVFILPGT